MDTNPSQLLDKSAVIRYDTSIDTLLTRIDLPMLKSLTKISVYIAVFLIPFYFFRFSLLGIKTNVFEIFVLVSFFLTLFEPKSLKRLSVKSIWLLPVAFLTVSLITAFLSSDKMNALGIWKGWFLVPIVFAWVINKNFDPKSLWRGLLPLFVSMVVVSLWAILQKAGLFTTLFYQTGDATFNQYISQGRVFGPFESPNFLAMFLVPTMFITLPIAEQVKQRIGKIVFLFTYALPILALCFSGSRAGIIAFAVGLCVYLNYRYINLQKAKNRQPFYSGLFVTILAGVNLLYLYYAINVARPSSASDQLRVQIYRYSVDLLKDNFSFGLGLGQFQNKIAQISAGNVSFHDAGLGVALHPHNLLLAVWLNLGLAGLIVLLWLMVSFFKNVFSSNSPIRAASIAAMFAILIHGLFDTTYFKNDLSAIFWLVFISSIIIKNEKNITDI